MRRKSASPGPTRSVARPSSWHSMRVSALRSKEGRAASSEAKWRLEFPPGGDGTSVSVGPEARLRRGKSKTLQPPQLAGARSVGTAAVSAAGLGVRAGPRRSREAAVGAVGVGAASGAPRRDRTGWRVELGLEGARSLTDRERGEEEEERVAGGGGGASRFGYQALLDAERQGARPAREDPELAGPVCRTGAAVADGGVGAAGRGERAG